MYFGYMDPYDMGIYEWDEDDSDLAPLTVRDISPDPLADFDDFDDIDPDAPVEFSDEFNEYYEE